MKAALFPVRLATATLSAMLALAGCLGQPQARSAPSDTDISFAQSLHDCRMRQPDRVNRRLNLAPASPSVSACLQRAGWRSDGIPLDLDDALNGEPQTRTQDDTSVADVTPLRSAMQ